MEKILEFFGKLVFVSESKKKWRMFLLLREFVLPLQSISLKMSGETCLLGGANGNDFKNNNYKNL